MQAGDTEADPLPENILDTPRTYCRDKAKQKSKFRTHHLSSNSVFNMQHNNRRMDSIYATILP